MPPEKRSLYDGIPINLPEELIHPLYETGSVRIERIVSDGHSTPPGEWYDQKNDEWVLLLSGSALLQFSDGETLPLIPGEYVMIPAGCRHRVEETDPDRKSIWLAIHFKAA